IWARVPLVGNGSQADPIRPMFVPAPPPMPTKDRPAVAVAATPIDRSGILSYQMQISDDGKWALVEFVGATPKDLQIITSSKDPNVKFFEKGKTTKEDIEAEFQKYKTNFKFDMLAARAQ